MRSVNNKFATLQINGEAKTLTVADLLKEAVNVVPEKGFTVSDIQSRLKVLSVINTAKENNDTALSFEDADFKIACDCVAAMRWAVLDPFIIEFSEMFK